MNENCALISCPVPDNTLQDYLNQYSLQGVIVGNTEFSTIIDGVAVTIPAGTFTYSIPPGGVFSPLVYQGCSSVVSVPVPPGSSSAQIQSLVQGMLQQVAAQQAACNAAAIVQPPAQFTNVQVTVESSCASPLQLVITGSLPPGVIQSGNNLILAAGVFASNVSQDDVDTAAIAFLNNLLNDLFNSGRATCTTPTQVLVMKDDEVGNVLPTRMRGIRKLGSSLFVGTSFDASVLKIYTSADATSWSPIIIDTIAGINAISDFAFGNGVYVAVTRNNSNLNSTNEGTAYVSSDLVTWTKHSIGGASGVTNHSFAYIAFGAGVFVAVSLNGNRAHSTDGISWTTVAGLGNVYEQVRFINGVFVAINSAGSAEFSSDGLSWSNHSVGHPIAFDVAYGAGLYVAVCAGFGVVTSPDGVTWTNSSAQVLTAISFGNGKFIGAGNSTALYESTDAATWTLMAKTPSQNMVASGIEYFGSGIFVAIENY